MFRKRFRSSFLCWLLGYEELNHERSTFSQESGVLSRRNSELVVEAVMPYFFHVVPIVDNTVFDGIGELKNSLLGLSFLSDIAVFVHADHDVFIFWSSDNRWEGGSWGIISWQSSLAHTWSVVNNYGNSFLFWHLNKKFIVGKYLQHTNTLRTLLHKK